MSLFRSKIFLRQFIAFIVLIGFTFFTISFVLLTATRISLEKQQLNIVENYHLQVSKAILSWLVSTDNYLKSQALHLGQLGEENLDSKEVQEIIKKEVMSNNNLEDILVVDEDGNILNSIGGPREKVKLADRSYVINGLKGQSTITGFYRSANTGIPVMAIGHPIIIDGQPRYVVAGIIGLRRVKELVENHHFGRYGQAYLVDQEGTFITDSGFISEFFKGIADKKKYQVHSKAVEEVLEKKEGTNAYEDFMGHKVFGSYQWLEPLQVGLIVEFKAEQAMAPINDLLKVIGVLAAVVGVIGILIAFIFSRKLVRPINLLVNATNDIIQQNYDKPTEIITGTELDILASRFNCMQDAIRTREDKLKELSMKDGLTRIYNHALLIELFEREYTKSLRTKESISFIMLDIDYFKKINDTYGHIAGDTVLKELAAILTDSVRGSDIVGRYGGEEFSIVIPGTDCGSVYHICERIRRRIESCNFNQEEILIKATVSIGICCRSADQQIDLKDMIKSADDALYMAKRNGRNRIEINNMKNE